MKISSDIATAKKNYPEMFHVVSSNEVHSFDSKEQAEEDLEDAKHAEERANTGFIPCIE